MEKTKKILFPTDLSKSALAAWDTALIMAKGLKADIWLLHVIEPPVGVVKLLGEYEEELAVKHARRLMDEFIGSLEVDGIRFHRMVKTGKPHKKVVEAAWEIDPNLIIMGTHGSSGLKEYLVGSNASKIIRSAPCPVISVNRKTEKTSIDSIMLPLDLTKETNEKAKVGIQLAQLFDAKLHLVSVLTSGGKKSEVHQTLKEQLEKTAKKLSEKGVKVDAQILISDEGIGKTIIKQAQKEGADMICIMTQQELNIKELFLGANASYIVNHSKIPILSVRPKQYFPQKKAGSVFG